MNYSTKKGFGSKSKQKIRIGAPKAVNTDNLLATSAAKLAPKIMPYIRFDFVNTAVRERPCSLGCRRPPYIIAQVCVQIWAAEFPCQNIMNENQK